MTGREAGKERMEDFVPEFPVTMTISQSCNKWYEHIKLLIQIDVIMQSFKDLM